MNPFDSSSSLDEASEQKKQDQSATEEEQVVEKTVVENEETEDSVENAVPKTTEQDDEALQQDEAGLRSKSTNPFSYDDEDEEGPGEIAEAKSVHSPRSPQSPPPLTAAASTNPFDEEVDEAPDDERFKGSFSRDVDGPEGKTFDDEEEIEFQQESGDDDLPHAGSGFLVRKGEDVSVDGTGDDEEDEIDFLYDNPRDMTLGRRIALSLIDQSWYNPRAGQDDDDEVEAQDGTTTTRRDILRASAKPESRLGSLEAYPFSRARGGTPSLAKAWAYFEHFALPRHIVDEQPPESEENNGDSGDNEKKDEDDNDLDEKEGKDEEEGLPSSSAVEQPAADADDPPNGASPPPPQKRSYNRAEPGEKHLATKLYNPFCTPHQELGDWGLGIGLYFTTLRALCVVTFVAGLLSIPNIWYYASDKYNENGGSQNVTAHLKGSAICTDVTWVACIDCQWDDFPDGRIGMGVDESTGATTVFALRNNCEGATLGTGLVHLVVLGVVVAGVAIVNGLVRRAEVAFDEDEQTAQDYSIVIRNPPEDATDPEEWRTFFHDNFDGAQVTACTIGIDNDLLVRSLVERRENLRWIEMKVDPGESLDTLTLARIAAEEERNRKFFGRLLAATVWPGIPEHFAKVVVATAKIQGLAQVEEHPVSNVFCTFEHEADQRRVLQALSIGKHAARTNHLDAVEDPRHLFREKYVLRITEPEEPSAIRWHDLNEKRSDRWRQQTLTTLTTLGMICAIAVLVRESAAANVRLAAFVIAFCNAIFPRFAKFLTSLEAHASEGGKQRSLYIKVAFFRWVNTAVVITIITPFTNILENDQGLIQQIFALFFAEIITTTAIQLADVMGHVSRHILAPRAKNQDMMNLQMQGSAFDLSERYTNLTKVFLLSVWYAALFPTTLFLCSLTLFIDYYVDRFSLMRTWKPVPHLGPRISAFSRQYFMPLALVAMGLLSAYFWSGFPYDNLCEQQDGAAATAAATGTFTVDPKGSGDRFQVTVTLGDDATFMYCRQDFFRYYSGERSFPFTARNQKGGLEWMTEEQETVTMIWGVISVAFMGCVVLVVLFHWYKGLRAYFKGDYQPRGADQQRPFSQEASISTYVPQVVSPVFPYPLLACNLDALDTDLLDWTDADRPHSFYDLTKDAQFLLAGTDISTNIVFSKMAHWRPNGEDGKKTN